MSRILNFYSRTKLQTKIILLTTFLILSIFFILFLYSQFMVSHLVEDEIGEKALDISKTISQMPAIIEGFEADDPAEVIQPLIEPIRKSIGAEFIVIGNKDEIRYSHSLPERIGEKMVGSDNEGALKRGESYISKKEGSLGPSIRGKTPIINKDKEIIGVVSVGYLTTDIDQLIREKNITIALLFISFLIVGIIGSIVIANYIKNLLFNMEPQEISELLLKKEAILQSTIEGIIAIDNDHRITLLNKSARKILGLDVKGKSYENKKVDDYIDNKDVFTSFTSQDVVYNKEAVLNNKLVLMNIHPLYERNKCIGAVASFRLKDDLELITQELNSVKQYTNGLRAQTHEFSNKLYTILGLLQLNKNAAAIEFIENEYGIQTRRNTFLLNNVTNPAVHGLLLAKYNEANECDIKLNIDPNSHLSKPITPTQQDVLIKTFGNLIDNAMDSVNKRSKDKQINVFFTDLGKEFILEIDDNGTGIPASIEDKLFDSGFSTNKESHRGNGLYLVKTALQMINGVIFIEESELGGSCFVVTYPLEREI